MPIYDLQDPLPFEGFNYVEEEPVEPGTTQFERGVDWRDPGPCIICGVPHCACTGNEDWITP